MQDGRFLPKPKPPPGMSFFPNTIYIPFLLTICRRCQSQETGRRPRRWLLPRRKRCSPGTRRPQRPRVVRRQWWLLSRRRKGCSPWRRLLRRTRRRILPRCTARPWQILDAVIVCLSWLSIPCAHTRLSVCVCVSLSLQHGPGVLGNSKNTHSKKCGHVLWFYGGGWIVGRERERESVPSLGRQFSRENNHCVI
jgi:hypothetical protein